MTDLPDLDVRGRIARLVDPDAWRAEPQWYTYNGLGRAMDILAARNRALATADAILAATEAQALSEITRLREERHTVSNEQYQALTRTVGETLDRAEAAEATLEEVYRIAAGWKVPKSDEALMAIRKLAQKAVAPRAITVMGSADAARRRAEARALSAETKVERLREALVAIEADEYGDTHREIARAVLISETDGSARASRDARSSTRPEGQSVDGGGQ